MGIDLFTTRCGCGAILKRRQGCETCAVRARAKADAKADVIGYWGGGVRPYPGVVYARHGVQALSKYLSAFAVPHDARALHCACRGCHVARLEKAAQAAANAHNVDIHEIVIPADQPTGVYNFVLMQQLGLLELERVCACHKQGDTSSVLVRGVLRGSFLKLDQHAMREREQRGLVWYSYVIGGGCVRHEDTQVSAWNIGASQAELRIGGAESKSQWDRAFDDEMDSDRRMRLRHALGGAKGARIP